AFEIPAIFGRLMWYSLELSAVISSSKTAPEKAAKAGFSFERSKRITAGVAPKAGRVAGIGIVAVTYLATVWVVVTVPPVSSACAQVASRPCTTAVFAGFE